MVAAAAPKCYDARQPHPLLPIMDLLGFGLATLALILFGLYMVPRKLTKLRDLPFVLSMSVGVVITIIGASLLVHHRPLLTGQQPGEWFGFICGPLWYGGVLFYTISVTQMGLTLATPIKNTTAVLGTLIGLAYFAEWHETRPAPALLGALLVVLCAVIISRTGEEAAHRSSITTTGVVAGVVSAILFASYTIPFKLAQQAGLDSVTLVAYMGLGTLAAAVAAFAVLDRNWLGWWRAPRRDHLYAALCGLIWVIAVIAMAGAIERIGLAITWPFTNLNMIVTVACGILFFHEVSVRRFWRELLFGLGAGVVGVALLGLARL